MRRHVPQLSPHQWHPCFHSNQGRVKGKGCAALGSGKPARRSCTEEAGRRGGEGVFPTAGLSTHPGAPVPGLACPLASNPLPSLCTFRCSRAQSHSPLRFPGSGKTQHPPSILQFCPSWWGARGGWGGSRERGKGTLEAFCFYKCKLSNSAIFRLLSSTLWAPGGFGRAQREDESLWHPQCLCVFSWKAKLNIHRGCYQTRQVASACWLRPWAGAPFKQFPKLVVKGQKYFTDHPLLESKFHIAVFANGRPQSRHFAPQITSMLHYSEGKKHFHVLEPYLQPDRRGISGPL